MKRPKRRTERARFTFEHKRNRISLTIASNGNPWGPTNAAQLMRTIFTTLAQATETP